MTVHDILNESTKALEEIDSPSARLDAEVLLSFSLGCDLLEFYKNPDMTIEQSSSLPRFENFSPAGCNGNRWLTLRAARNSGHLRWK